MISFDYKPQGVCTRNIHLDLSDDGNKVVGVEFTGGCNGNLKAISKLVPRCMGRYCVRLWYPLSRFSLVIPAV
jgi:hypothetical protein